MKMLAAARNAGLGKRGEVLGLAVAVLVAPVGRLGGDADREEREQGRDEVGARVDRLGDQAEAVRGEADRELERDERRRRGDRHERGPALRCQSSSSGQTSTSCAAAYSRWGSPSSDDRRERARGDRRLRGPEPPRRMVQLRPVQAAAVGGVDAVPLGQEVLERARLGDELVACRPVARGEREPVPDGLRGARGPTPLAVTLEGHPRAVRRQAVDALGGLEQDRVRHVDRAQPDARPAVEA